MVESYKFNENDILDEYDAVTPFEEVILGAIKKKVTEKHFKNIFVQTQFYIAESKHPNIPGKTNPPLYINADFGSLIAIFSTKYRLRLFNDAIKSYGIMWGREIVIQTPPDKGLILNPDSFLTFQLAPASLQDIRETLL